MNSIILTKNLLKEKGELELDHYLSGIWNRVWARNGRIDYTELRLFKTADKLRKLSERGINFKDRKVLDIGCGDGTTLMYLRKYFNVSGVGVDISNDVISQLKEDLSDEKLSFTIGDHRDLSDIRNGEFDFVLSFGVIEHFEEFGLAIAEARRVLKRGGHLILIQPHLFSLGVVQEYFLRVTNAWQFGDQKDFSCFKYKSILKEASFKNIIYFTQPPYSDMGFCRRLDLVIKKIIPFWGHYLYVIGEK